ncbi:MAG TPA: hypothetical protein VGK30_10370 [Candidatus Binatia bacterium]|jgi:hypothetical protein
MTDVRQSSLVARHPWRCLSDWTLVQLAEGDGTSRQRRHLAECTHCAARHAAVVQARGTAASVLRAAAWRFTPASGGSVARVPARWRRDLVRVATPFAVAAALVVAFLLGTHHPTRIASDAATPAVASSGNPSLDDVARSVFTIDDASVWLEADADDTRWEAALLGDGPCETAEGATDPLCN